MAKDEPTTIYRNARPEDIESLKTIVPRSFFKDLPWMEAMFPDTTDIREWWGRVYEDLIASPNSYLPIAVDTASNTVIGAMTVDAVLQGEPAGGVLTRIPATQDHGEDWPEVLKTFAGEDREYVGDRNRFLIDIMGVDTAYQGRGIGQKLVAMACGFADAKGWPIYLNTGQAKGFYLKQALGFQAVASKDDPDDPEAKDGKLLRETVPKS
ncbi:hypothetical protein PRZ48_013530 [Zasmidium cellare]|uniref:N-acetyltransferase domain-containing protein n=1 Tax=Zasmidium cellare TaxID=395010 RepID=A0ABR0E1T9_ZASCE|nr:hypothetical protein PRZ48_013530 [Zasmidium cellare]